MKNIHLIQTDKPTGLFESQTGVLHYSIMNKVRTGLLKGYHIYITSDEEIKEGDWVYRDSGIVFKMTQELLEYYESIKDKDTHKRYKIILTTDPDLISDGIQAIDGEFSEWFVQNPSCESVEVKKRYSEFTVEPFVGYKIIIPQERHTIITDWLTENGDPEIDKKVEKQLELEEASWRYNPLKKLDGEFIRQAFKDGAKWMAERRYSEEDMKQFGLYLGDNLKKLKGKTIDDIFEQFKKE